MAGRVMRTTEGNAVYSKPHFGFDPFEYAGECCRIEEISKEQGDLTAQHCIDPRSGRIRVTGTSRGAPGLVSTTLAMKERQRQYLVDELENCRWDLDRRSHCNNVDDPLAWEEILRVCDGVVTTPAHAGIDYEGDGGDMMVSLPVTAVGYGKIYRVTAAACELTSALAVSWVDVSRCNDPTCRLCGPASGCRFAAVSTILAQGSPYLKVYETDGRALELVGTYELTEWTTDGASAVLCLADYIFIVSDGETLPILRSRDGGVTRVALAGNADMAANPPRCIAGLSLSTIMVGGENGYIYMTNDGADNFTTVDAGIVTTENINKIFICPDDPSVMYFVGDNNAMGKSEDGGYTWQPVTGPSPGDDLNDIVAYNTYDILVVNDDAELWQSEDGTETWEQQADLEGLAGSPVGVGLAYCGCSVGTGFLVGYDTATSFLSGGPFVYRNVNSGSYWREITGSPLVVSEGLNPAAVACCGPNLAMVVGGNGVDGGFISVVSNGYSFSCETGGPV